MLAAAAIWRDEAEAGWRGRRRPRLGGAQRAAGRVAVLPEALRRLGRPAGWLDEAGWRVRAGAAARRLDGAGGIRASAAPRCSTSGRDGRWWSTGSRGSSGRGAREGTRTVPRRWCSRSRERLRPAGSRRAASRARADARAGRASTRPPRLRSRVRSWRRGRINAGRPRGTSRPAGRCSRGGGSAAWSAIGADRRRATVKSSWVAGRATSERFKVIPVTTEAVRLSSPKQIFAEPVVPRRRSVEALARVKRVADRGGRPDEGLGRTIATRGWVASASRRASTARRPGRRNPGGRRTPRSSTRREPRGYTRTASRRLARTRRGGSAAASAGRRPVSTTRRRDRSRAWRSSRDRGGSGEHQGGQQREHPESHDR